MTIRLPESEPSIVIRIHQCASPTTSNRTKSKWQTEIELHKRT
jgi:hypothetical protein